ncbi:hypothetical protein SERLA73DRAFT_26917, partial [Serpula lacrymans var. lacrymans S7.3]
FPKGLAQKLIPKFIGPYLLEEDFNNNSFRVNLPSNLHPVFHSSLMRIHIPNDDRLFPGRLESQLSEQDDADKQWAIDKIMGHKGVRDNAIFEVLWKAGDITWVPYAKIEYLEALKEYFTTLGI